MRYIRFESQERCEDSASRLGIFQIAYRVRDAHATSLHDAKEIGRHLEWLKAHLHSPHEIEREANRRAIFWFKQNAKAPIERMWAIKPYIEAYGYWIDLRTTWTPGVVVYEDGWQVAAIPR
jgi:hypothetical protein